MSNDQEPPQPPAPEPAEGGGFFWELFEVARASMALFDDDRRYVAVNDAAVALLGRSREELVGYSSDDFIAPEEREQRRRDWDRLLRDGAFVGSTKLVTPQGEVRPIEYSATANVVPGRHLVITLIGSRNDPRPRPHYDADTPVTPANIGSPGSRTDVSLTVRERDVLWLLADGATNTEIADALGIRRPTVQGHVASIKQRLGATTRAQAVAIALRDGLLQRVDPDERVYINRVFRDEDGHVVETTIDYINQDALAREPQLAEHLSKPITSWYPAARDEILPIIARAVTTGEEVTFTELHMSDAFGEGSWRIAGRAIPLGRERVVVRYRFPEDAFGGPPPGR